MKPTYEKNLNWDDLKIILAICRAGSLSGAARVLGSSHSTVFRQINGIEKNFSTRFFHRLPNGYEMTEAGEAALSVATRIEEEIHGLSRELQGKDLRLQGKIKLTAPEGISHYILSPLLSQFYRLHPDIHIDLIVTSSPLELSRQEADIAIRITSNPPEASIGKKVCCFNAAMYATKSFLAKSKNKPINEYELAMSNDGLNWIPNTVWKNRSKPNIIFSCDSILGVVNTVKDGVSAAMLPCFIGDQEKKLQRVTDPLPELSNELWILTHADLRQTARVRALMQHLYESLSNIKGKFEGIV